MSYASRRDETDAAQARRSPFVHSDIVIAAVGALIMAVAGAGMASWFGPGDFGAAYADTYTTSSTTLAQN